MKKFSLFVEEKDSEDRVKQAIFSQLGINPDHVASRMDDELQSFSNASELEKMPILDELPPDVKASAISAIQDGSTKLRDLISILSRDSDISRDVQMQPQFSGNPSSPF